MCQGYEAERRGIVMSENLAAVAGFKAAQKGEPKSSNPYNHLHWNEYAREAWDNGWGCWHERILPWAIGGALRINGDYAGAQKAETFFEKTGKLPVIVKKILKTL